MQMDDSCGGRLKCHQNCFQLLPFSGWQERLFYYFFINNMVRGQWYLTKQQQALRHEVSLQIQHNQQEQHKVPMEDPALTQHQTNSDVCLQQHSTGDSLPLPKAWPLKYSYIAFTSPKKRLSSAQCSPTPSSGCPTGQHTLPQEGGYKNHGRALHSRVLLIPSSFLSWFFKIVFSFLPMEENMFAHHSRVNSTRTSLLV